MRTTQLTITFPQGKSLLKKELIRQKNEENLYVSSYVTSLIEKDIGYLSYSR